MGLLALAGLGVVAAAVPAAGTPQAHAVVFPSRAFSLSAVAPGRYVWTVESGRPAFGPAVETQRVVQVERNDVVELTLDPALVDGATVEAGATLATLRSALWDRLGEELDATRAELDARAALQEAGGRPEVIAAARQALAVARGQREALEPELQRLAALSASGAVSDAQRQQLELSARVRDLEVSLARSQVAVAEVPAREEERAVLLAERASLEARVAELALLREQSTIIAPIGGLLELGGAAEAVPLVLRVYETNMIYIRFPVPEQLRARVTDGLTLEFDATSTPDRVWVGQIIDVADRAITLNGEQVFWASAAVDNADGALLPGMSGEVQLDVDGGSQGFLSALRDAVGGI